MTDLVDVAAPKPLRVVYVMLADPGESMPLDTFERWPTAGLTTAAIAAAAADSVEVLALARTRRSATIVGQAGVRWHFVTDRSRNAWRTVWRLRSLRADVVHLNGVSHAVAAIAARIAVGRGARIVVQHHGDPVPHGVSRLLQRLAGRFVDGYLFTGGRSNADGFVRAGIVTSRHQVADVIEAASTLERDSAALEVTGRVLQIVCIARLIAGKDVPTVIGGFRQLLDQAPDARLTIVAGGRDSAVDREVHDLIAADDRLGRAVRVVGPLSRAEVAAALSSADVFVSASRAEGSGYALIEALACGCRPAVSDIPPHRAIAGDLATYFAVGDSEACGRALAAACAARGGRDEVVRFAAERLGWDSIGRSLCEAYRAVARPGARRHR